MKFLPATKIIALGKHTTTLSDSPPYQNTISIPGVLSTDLVFPSFESQASGGGTPATATLLQGTQDIVVSTVENGTTYNGFEVDLVPQPDAGAQEEDWHFLIVGDLETALGIQITGNGANNLHFVDIVAALNAKVSGTYGTAQVVFMGGAELLEPFEFSGGTSDLLAPDDSDGQVLAGGTDGSSQNIKTASAGNGSITFEFSESLVAGHVISYLVIRAVA